MAIVKHLNKCPEQWDLVWITNSERLYCQGLRMEFNSGGGPACLSLFYSFALTLTRQAFQNP